MDRLTQHIPPKRQARRQQGVSANASVPTVRHPCCCHNLAIAIMHFEVMGHVPYRGATASLPAARQPQLQASGVTIQCAMPAW